MRIVTFETPDDDDIDIDTETVISVRSGREEGTVTIELDDGSEVMVVSTALEAAADLGLDPLDVLDEDESGHEDDEEVED